MSKRLRNIIYALFWITIVLLCHYWIAQIHVANFEMIRMATSAAKFTLLLFGATFLLMNFRDVGNCKVFAIQMILLMLFGLIMLVVTLTSENPLTGDNILIPAILILGNFYCYITLLYPIYILSPNKQKTGRFLWVFAPVPILGIIYYTVINIQGVTPTIITSWPEILAGIDRFEVWFRFVMLSYPLWCVAIMYSFRKSFTDWHKDNFYAHDCEGISWINSYILGFSLLMLSYTIALTSVSHQNALLHIILFEVFVGFVIYKLITQRIYSSRRISVVVDEYIESQGVKVANTESKSASKIEVDLDSNFDLDDDKYRFADRLEEYKATLQEWMTREKPYRNSDFKLLDIMKVLPLNRSYISKLFNETYGDSFFTCVQRFRIEDSIYLLENHPEISITRIAQLCGFSSPSVFGRSFLKSTRVTPLQYRISALDKVSDSDIKRAHDEDDALSI